MCSPISQYRKLVATSLSSNFRHATEIVSAAFPDKLKPTELLVKNYYVGINASDINFTAGRYKPDVQVPFDCGFEALGEIIAIGSNIKHFAVGNYVVTQSYGAFSEFQIVSSRSAKKVPSMKKEFLPLDLSGTTASIALAEVLKPVKGEVALVTAASGGTGHFAVQLLKKVYGCSVIGVTSSSLKKSFLNDIGCDDVIVEGSEPIGTALRRLSPTGVNISYESVGGRTLDAVVNNISLRGRILSVGSISGYSDGSSWRYAGVGEVPIHTRLLSKSATLHTFFLPHFIKHTNSHFSNMCQLYTQGIIKSFVDPKTFKGLESVSDAVDYMYQRKNVGKIVVEI
ncbi:Alcohol dehydrogenase GroES like domain [Trypanosoma vivax]|uniref:Putative quinone oxidoreductase n=1 Tax=Trypanosoma vivax (strain Y486) TaxID=1055687 RepID=G0U7N7_TRYVY|nr:putative quinone oxidoreductase [Trypanosoma vivax]KAH8620696.1 Alcohol dehydrogenase GroES like domain [Trypanosoma vivax]CCC51895.1 putative quinone oxidoreductase [Trypanosoma vivax Y486]